MRPDEAAQQILHQLAHISRAWWPLAVAWHIYVVALAASLALRWRPSRRLAALLLSAPLVSVALLALAAGNPFTSAVLLVTVVLANMAVRRLAPARILVSSHVPSAVGGGLVVFGLAYPHFLESAVTIRYLYAAPVGLIPCPTLAFVIGASIALGSLGSRSWGLIVGGVGLLYALIGCILLGVWLDGVLAAGSLILLVSVLSSRTLRPRAVAAR